MTVHRGLQKVIIFSCVPLLRGTGALNRRANVANDIHVKPAGEILFIKRHVSSNISKQCMSLAVRFIHVWARTAVRMPQIVFHKFESALEILSSRCIDA